MRSLGLGGAIHAPPPNLEIDSRSQEPRVVRTLLGIECGDVFTGRWLFGADWFGPHREWAAFGVSVALSIFHWFWGTPLLQKNYQPTDPSQRSLTANQMVAVCVMMISAGAFGTWLFCAGPGQ